MFDLSAESVVAVVIGMAAAKCVFLELISDILIDLSMPIKGRHLAPLSDVFDHYCANSDLLCEVVV